MIQLHRRSFLDCAAAFGLSALTSGVGAQAMMGAHHDATVVTTAPDPLPAIRPFTAHVSDAALNDLRQRIAATRWPERETVNDISQGVQLARLQELVRPQVLGYGLADSPIAFAAFMYDYNNGEPQRSLTQDEVLDDITLYWLTNTATSSARIYWENNNKSNTSATAQKTSEISLPVAVTVFPGEIYRAPRSWTQRAYRNLIYFSAVDKGGHFAAWEQPQLFSGELRAAFRPLR